ncbi:helix-turn-helix domain-containing protein [Brachybacterium sp. DNPG3]
MKHLTDTPMPSAQLDELEAVARGASAEVRDLLTSIVSSLRDGDEIVAVGPSETLTPNQAAKTLGMSRTHLYKLLDDGTIASHRVGRDRRIAIKDLADFADRRGAARHALAERFADQDRIREAAIDEIADLL